MKEIQIDELRELQMQILDYVDAFCRRHGIKYTISGGTLLGAVRHGGYIPWDDDIDIQMLREEYNRFTVLWNKFEKDQLYELISIESGNAIGYVFGKVHNLKTVTFVRGLERTGVYIDIFPVDDVIDNKDFQKRRRRIKSLKRKEGWAFLLSTRKTSHIGFINLCKAFLITLGKPRTYFAERINDEAKCKNEIGASFVFEMVAGIKCKKPIPKDVFMDYSYIKFENRTYMAVKDFDTYLAATFGDYMKLPPIEKQKREHNFVPYWR